MDTNQTRVREVFLLRERARKELRSFLSGIWSWHERDKFRHFRTGPDGRLRRPADMNNQEWKQFWKTGKLPDGVFESYAGEKKYEPGERIAAFSVQEEGREPPSRDKAGQYLKAMFSMLETCLLDNLGSPFESWSEKTIRKKVWREWASARRAELEVVLRLLNMPLWDVQWAIKDRKIRTRSNGQREIIEHFVAYLNLISECGPVHSVCEDCGTMFLKDKDRRLCHDCSKKHQTYKYRKDYLLKKKREYYKKQIQEDAEFKSQSKGAKGAKRKTKN